MTARHWIMVLAALLTVGCSARGADPAELARKAQQVLKAHCYRCHGQEGAVEGGFNYVLDRQRLVSTRKVVPGEPARSRVFKRLTSASEPMPPESEKVRPTKEEIAVIQQWIEAGAVDFNPAAAQREFVGDDAVLDAVLADLRKQNERARRFTRYFTLTHLYNAGLSEDELQTYRNGLSKLVNSLSWEPDIARPKAIDAAKTMFRIDLRDYQWSPPVWKKVLGQNPYAVRRDGETSKLIGELAEEELPYVRADWFVFAAARPPLYHDLLQVHKTDRELEDKLSVKVADNINGERVVRAGFNGSGVSRNNRLVERHRTSYGAYWKSYDFGGSAGRKNLFSHPLGPGPDDSLFQHDGGEIIFNLPNGLQAYMLVDGSGTRLDKGPTDIVSDPKRPDRAVENGISCMSCHVQGIIDKTDQVRAHVERNKEGFTKQEVETILALYPPREKFAELAREDAERYRKAVEKCGVQSGRTEPIVAIALRFEAELDVALAAAEAGLKPDDFIKAVDKSPALARVLGPLKLNGGTVQRQVFVEAFADMARTLKLGNTYRGVTTGIIIPPTQLKAKKVVELPERFAEVRTAGAGRYLVFQLKKAKKLAIFDVSAARIVREIDVLAEDVLFAGGLDRLMVVLPSQKVVQRYNLQTFQREKTAVIPGDRAVIRVAMGCNGQGPLLLWDKIKAVFLDTERMEPIDIKGKVFQSSGDWGFDIRTASGGQAFIGWTPGISSQRYELIRLDGNKSTSTLSPDAFSFNGHYAQPNPDASLIFRSDGPIYSASMKTIGTNAFKGGVFFPTEDPRFFLALRTQTREVDEIVIATTADCRPIHTVRDLEKMTSGLISTDRGYVGGEPRAHFVPSANVLVTLPESNDKVVVRPFSLMDALDQSNENYLFVASQPIIRARAGTNYRYPIDVVSKAGGVKFTLDAGPMGMAIASAELRWNVPASFEGKTVQVVVTIQDSKGKEILHSFDIAVE